MYHLKLATYWTVLASSYEGAFHEAHLLLFGDQSFFCQDWCVWPFSQLALSLKTMQSVMLTLNGLAYLVNLLWSDNVTWRPSVLFPVFTWMLLQG